MTVVSSKLKLEGSTGSFDDFNNTYVHQYEVITNDRDDGPGVVLVQGQLASPDPLPVQYSTYNLFDHSDNTSFCRSKVARRTIDDEGNFFHWLVTCTWRPADPGSPLNPPVPDNPLLDPIKYHVEWESFKTPVTKDKDDKPVVNSAGDPFEGIELDDYHPIIVAVKNVSNLDVVLSINDLYRHTTNSDTWVVGGSPGYPVPPGSARFESVTAGQLQQRAGISYYEAAYRVKLTKADENWDIEVVDRGQRAWTAPKGQPGAKLEPVRVLSGPNEGEPLFDFANLNPDGTQKADDADPPGDLLSFSILKEAQYWKLFI